MPRLNLAARLAGSEVYEPIAHALPPIACAMAKRVADDKMKLGDCRVDRNYHLSIAAGYELQIGEHIRPNVSNRLGALLEKAGWRIGDSLAETLAHHPETYEELYEGLRPSSAKAQLSRLLVYTYLTARGATIPSVLADCGEAKVNTGFMRVAVTDTRAAGLAVAGVLWVHVESALRAVNLEVQTPAGVPSLIKRVVSTLVEHACRGVENWSR